MNFKSAAVIMLSIAFAANSYSQSGSVSNEKFNLQSLSSKIISGNPNSIKVEINHPEVSTGKSPGLALLFSLILPGAGHYYLNRMDVGKYFLGADAASWLGLVSLNVYGNSVRNDSRTYSKQHAGISNIDDKNDDYFANIGNFTNIYEYNNDKLSRGEYALVYDVNQNYWNWDDIKNRDTFEGQRKRSERIYNTRIVFGSMLVVNRIVSGISAFFMAKNSGTKKTSLNIQPEVLYNGYSVDGVRINLSKNF